MRGTAALDNSVAYELYLYTIDAYKRLVSMLPLDERLARFDSRCFSKIGELELGDEAFAAVSVRLMLQRKYFVRGKDLFLRGLLKSADQDFATSKDVIEPLLDSLDALNSQSVEFAFGDGKVVDGAFANAEDVMYGLLMHADITRAENLVSVPERMRLVALAPYIAGREYVLLQFSEFLHSAGIKPLSRKEEASATVSFESKGACRQVENSPFWRNLRGRDLGDEDAEKIVHQASRDDLEIAATVLRFKEALSRRPLDLNELNSLVARETICRWDNYLQAAELLEGDYGMSALVMYQEDGSALAKLLPNVREPFLIEGPQLIEGGHDIVLVKRSGIWKIWAMRWLFSSSVDGRLSIGGQCIFLS